MNDRVNDDRHDLFDNPMGLMGFEFVELRVRDLRVGIHLALALPPVPANR